MKKLILSATLAGAFFAPQAFAQANNFQGFSLGGSVNIASTKSDNSVLGSGSATSDTNASLWAQYTMALGTQFTLGLGAAADVGELKAGTWSPGVDAKLKNMTSWYVAPGYAMSNSALFYGKIAAFTTKASATGQTDQDLSGYGYGIGFQNLLSKNLLMQYELMANKADEKSVGAAKLNGSNLVLSIGVGYKF